MFKEALALLAQASRILPDNRELLLSQAVTLSVLRRDDDAQKLLTKIQATWPEWDRPYLLNGIILEIQLKSSQALPLLETAIALGAATPDAYYYEALAITHATPEALDNAARAIGQALRLTAKDPYIFLLAGKISFDQKRYSVAIEQLQKATELLPTLIPAHYALRHAYQALGDEAKAATEMTAIKRIASETAASEKSPFPVEDFLFSVRPPS
jgi:tetratricopeptide (TPR) repeat protein